MRSRHANSHENSCKVKEEVSHDHKQYEAKDLNQNTLEKASFMGFYKSSIVS